jgi:hypothetical protein
MARVTLTKPSTRLRGQLSYIGKKKTKKKKKFMGYNCQQSGCLKVQFSLIRKKRKAAIDFCIGTS